MANILWIEDESKKIAGLIRPLKKRGHRVDVAENKKEAIDLISNFTYDIILLDIIIPSGENKQPEDIDPYEGVNVLDAIKASQNADTPIIVLSVVNDSNILRKLEKKGITIRLSKGSLLPSELMGHVSSLLGSENE